MGVGCWGLCSGVWVWAMYVGVYVVGYVYIRGFVCCGMCWGMCVVVVFWGCVLGYVLNIRGLCVFIRDLCVKPLFILATLCSSIYTSVGVYVLGFE